MKLGMMLGLHGMMFGQPSIAAIYPEEPLQLWPCSYIAGCSAAGCRRRATAILRYFDSKGRFGHQTHACEAHANEMCAAFRLPQFGSYLVSRSKVASELQGYRSSSVRESRDVGVARLRH